eukprot:jgi/Chrpa1/8007/Chrysochromulina_OHIO_Genome00017287-RA
MSVVGFTLELAGDVSSFTPSVQTEMKSAIAARAGVDPSAVEVAVSPGSVIIDVSIQTTTVTATSVQSMMASATSSPSSATAMLASITGISIAVLAVVTPPFVADVAPPPPPQPSPPPPISPGTDASSVETSGSTSFVVPITITLAIVLALAFVFMSRLRCRPDNTRRSMMTTPASAPTLQRFEDELGATFDGDPFPSSKVDQIMGKMREMGFKEFSRDDARVAVENFGNDLSVDMIVERILGTWPC